MVTKESRRCIDIAEVLNKVKPFIFLSFFQLFINIAIFLSAAITNNDFNILALIGLTGGAFVPFISLAGVVMSGFPVEVSAFVGIFTGIISAIQTYLIVEVVLSHLPLVDM